MNKEEQNNFYRKYGPNVHSDPIRFDAIAKLCKGRVLDVGCGTGDLADYYQGKYIGVDISDVAIEMAKKIRRKNANFLVGDFTKHFDIYETNFDTIVLAEFLEHLEDDTIVFENIKKVSKTNARWIITVPNGDRVPDKDHKRQFTVPELRKKFKKFGKVKFHNYEGFRERILLTVDLGEKNDNLLSLVMIVKNEGKGLERAILSCIDFVDNIVISVDKNSVDNTLEIAKRYADVLKLYEWKDDFADARNFAQEGVKTKWVLRLDGHEYVKEYKDLEKFLKKDVDALITKIRLETGFSFWFPTIIRNYVKWVKPVHNYPKVKTFIKYKNFLIQHDRKTTQKKKYIEQRTEQRSKMIFEILTQKVKENKKDTRSLFYLAQQCHYERKFKLAIKYYKKYLKYSKNKQERWLAWYELANCCNQISKPKLAIKYFKKAEKELPNRWEISKRLGATYMMMGKYKEALFYLVDSFKINKTDFIFEPEPRNDAQTWFFISQCLFALKEYEKAKIALKRAEKVQGKDEFSKLPKEQLKIIRELT